ncbi:MAG TPA: two-component regulator propeller domain-containing protein [Pelobium sp.]|nr:two-component regulator propeller domain-containing protein [Pelobium sp.]
MKKGLQVFVIISCLIKISYAQNITSIGIEQGLSNNTVTAIIKDKFGFMWFGTFDGLNKFDGSSFIKYRTVGSNSQSVPDNFITALSADSVGRLWVGTQKGLCIFYQEKSSFSTVNYLPYNPNTKTQPKKLNQQINALCTAPNGDVFIGAKNVGLLKYHNDSSKFALQIPLFIKGKLKKTYSVLALVNDLKQGVWILTADDGICYFNQEKKFAIQVDSSLIGNCAVIDKEGLLWIGTSFGLYSFNTKTKLLRSIRFTDKDISSPKITGLKLDLNGKLWITTDGRGLIVYDRKTNEVVQMLKEEDSESLTSNALNTIYIDDANRKWTGTIRGGINVIDSNRNYFKTVRHLPYNKNSLVNNTVMSFCEDGNDIWIGTDGGGISVWNREKSSFQQFVFNESGKQSTGANQITSIVKDKSGEIWLGTYGTGVKRFNAKNKTFEDIPFLQSDRSAKYVWKLYIDKNGDIWAGCIKGRWAGDLKSGLYKYDKKSNQFKVSEFAVNAEILSISDDEKGNLWLGTLSDLIKIPLDGKGGKKTFKLDSYIRDIVPDKKGNVWIASHGKGLWCLNSSSNKLTSYNESNGLPNNYVIQIEIDKSGMIWASTFNGLSRVNPFSKKIYNFHVEDGLQSNQFYYNASLTLQNGEMLFGGIKGFNIFNPNHLQINQSFPVIRFTGMSVLNNPLNINNEFVKRKNPYQPSEIILPYDKSMFSLDFVALEYSRPEKIKYAYYLEGWDKQWNYTNAKTLSYSRINEGHYLLKIKSTNSSGIWNTHYETVSVVILPPWYRTWWAYTLYLLALSTGIYGFIYYQKSKERLRYEVKLTKLEAKQEAELTQKRIGFFTNISHELRTPLTLIINPIKDLLNQPDDKPNQVDLDAVYRNARRMLSLVDQLLLFRNAENEISDFKPELLDIAEVCREVFFCFSNQLYSKNIKNEINIDTNPIAVFADREKIEIVLFNLISNAIKYTPEDGRISVDLKENENQVEISIADSGLGIDPSIGDSLFEHSYRANQLNSDKKISGFGIGLFVSKKIAEQQEGSLTYVSIPKEGTVFKYIIPKNTKGIVADGTPKSKMRGESLINEMIEEPIPVILEKDQEDILDLVGDVPVLLLVDDEKEIRNYMKSLLYKSYKIYEAASAEIALELLKKITPDLILSDVMMPGISGVELCQNLKSAKNTNHIPVILLTGTSSTEIKLKGIECGADDYITKPFDNVLLLARIKSILKDRASLKRYFINEITLQNNDEKVADDYKVFLKKCIEIVETHIEDEDFNVNAFVEKMEMSHSNIFRKVKSISGLSLSEFVRYIRLKKAAELLIKTDLQIKEVAFKVGLNDVKYFRRQFFTLFKQNPSDYIKKYRKIYR